MDVIFDLNSSGGEYLVCAAGDCRLTLWECLSAAAGSMSSPPLTQVTHRMSTL